MSFIYGQIPGGYYVVPTPYWLVPQPATFTTPVQVTVQPSPVAYNYNFPQQIIVPPVPQQVLWPEQPLAATEQTFQVENGQPQHKRNHAAKRAHNLYCHFCNTRETPEWRKGPAGKHTLCNACGLRYAKKLRQQLGVRKKMSFENLLS